MRHIKFRVWDKVNKRMVYFESGFKWHDEYNLWYLSPDDSVKNNQMVSDVPCEENIVLMQFTGLKDKNGKEIYEGDVLSWSEYQGWEDGRTFYGRYEVKWHEENLRFDLYDPFENSWWELYDTDFDEVIGNIYENPDLLKE